MDYEIETLKEQQKQYNKRKVKVKMKVINKRNKIRESLNGRNGRDDLLVGIERKSNKKQRTREEKSFTVMFELRLRRQYLL